MNTFTPAPWIVEGTSVYALQDCVWRGKPAKENRFYAGISGKCPDSEKIANAHLIAAAPELLEALELICDSGCPLPDFLTDKMNAAISKARAGV